MNTPSPSRASPRLTRQRGATTVELALVLGIFLSLLIGVCEFSRVLFYWSTATEAVRLGARTAVVCDADASVIKTRMTALLPLLSTSNISVSYLPSGCDSDAPTARSSCSTVTVSVTNVKVKTMFPFMPLTLTMPPLTTTLPRESLASSTGGTVCN